MKVLHVAETAQGGVGSYIEEIVDVQTRRYGADAVRAVLPAAHARHFKRLPEAALTTFELAPKGRLAHSLVMARHVRAIVRDWQPDVVHLHSSFAGLVVRPLLALSGSHRPRVVYCPHGWAFDRRVSAASNRVSAVIERVLSPVSDAIVCVSDADRRTALDAGIADRRLVVIPNGVRDLDSPPDRAAALARWPQGRRRLLFVGRLDDQKGIDIFADVLRGLGDRVFAVIVGAPVVGGEMPDLPDNCVVTGWLAREDIAALYAAAEVLVMPSRWEGLPIVAIEAQRAGLPVVSSAVGGLTEVIDPGVNGELVPSNAAADFVRVLSQLDDAALERMRAHARRSFETRFRIERVVERLDTAYRGAVPT